MNILVTGANGFIGRSIMTSELMHQYNIFLTSRKTLDVTDRDALTEFIRKNKINIIIHTAVKGHPGEDSIWTMSETLKADFNILHMNRLVDRIIIFGSGAEYNTKNNIDKVRERDLLNPPNPPTDYYGMSKYITTRSAQVIENVYNLRLFGCFGPLENNNRFIKNSINRVFKNCNISIHRDRYFDFFYIDDLLQLINYYINNDSKFKEINCVYDKKLKLSDVAKIIQQNLIKKDPIISIHNKDGLDKSYTAEPDHIDFIKPEHFKGLEQGIKEMIISKELNEKN